MPIISRTGSEAASSTELEPGTYYATALAIHENARAAGSIEVGIGKIRLLSKDSNDILWTHSLQSCFPVIMKYKNGDIALYHGNGGALQHLTAYIDRDDLVEIQLFEKGTMNNRLKVKGFAQNLVAYFKEKKQQPVINVQIKSDVAIYNTAICYKVNKECVILVGESTSLGGMAKNMASCNNKKDEVRACHFQHAADKYPPVIIQEEQEHNEATNIEEVHIEISPTTSCCLVM